MKLIFLKGIPASGKSTWAKEQVAKAPNDWVRVNKDDLRSMMSNGEYSKSLEEVVKRAERDAVRFALEEGKNVIVDNTHFTGDHESHYRNLVEFENARRNRLPRSMLHRKAMEFYEFEIKEFRTPLGECLKRNAERSVPVPEDRIKEMAKQSGWYDYEFAPNAPFTEGLPYCVVVDIDGTVAKMKGRSPYDYSRVREDVPNEPVCELVRTLHKNGENIVFVSGRPDSCYDASVKWINDNVFPFLYPDEFELHMRKTGDKRKGFIVKEEIYREKVMPKYNVRFVLDDRKQVVDHIRSLGFTVLQVAPGDF